jgi:hypothetical protein
MHGYHISKVEMGMKVLTYNLLNSNTKTFFNHSHWTSSLLLVKHGSSLLADDIFQLNVTYTYVDSNIYLTFVYRQ